MGILDSIIVDNCRALRWIARESGNRLPLTKFLPLLRAGVSAAPDRTDLKLQLAKTLFHTDNMAELVEWLRPIIANDQDPELLYYLGCGALVLRDYQLAFDALQLAAAKGVGRAFGPLAEVIGRLGRSDESLEVALQGLEHSASDFKALGIVVRRLLDRGETQRLWSLCLDLRTRGAYGGYLPSAMAAAAATPEQESEVAAFVDPQRWFFATQLRVPDNLNQRIADELLADRALSALPSTRSTTGAGSRIDQLHLAGGPFVQDLLDRIRAVVDTYVVERQAITDHPLMARRPASVALNSWALAVQRDGHEEWHIHPSGWISGVYYARVPRVKPDPQTKYGALEFGPFPFGVERETRAWPCWHEMPKVGVLLLFPSYYAHRTWPTGVSDPRVCVAFDIVSAS